MVNQYGLTTPNQTIPSNPPARIAKGAVTPNHLENTNAVAEIKTNHDSVVIELPSLPGAMRAMSDNRMTAVNTSPTAPHSIPFSMCVNNLFDRIRYHKTRMEVLITMPGRYIPMYPSNAPTNGLGAARAPRKTAKF